MSSRGRGAAQEPARAEAGAVEAVEKFGLRPKKGEKRLSYAMHRPGMAAASGLVERLTSKGRRQVRFEDEGASGSTEGRKEKGG